MDFGITSELIRYLHSKLGSSAEHQISHLLLQSSVVAIKMLKRRGNQSQGEKEFLQEVNVLSASDHSNVIKLIGYSRMPC
ncbi:hypothetical protein C5167_035747 [Papaver somniferum]|nr:hypothetical protein C5167_035747 [Papaver somniferum]